MKKLYNYLGEDITNKQIELLSLEFGYVDENNHPHIYWEKENNEHDSDGFDKSHRPFKDEETYIIKDFVLLPGTILCRYGFPGGKFKTLKGTPYESLGLPYVKETIEYHEYVVLNVINVNCVVVKGLVAPMFDSEGGAIQFKHNQPIYNECKAGFLKEDFLWMKKDVLES